MRSTASRTTAFRTMVAVTAALLAPTASLAQQQLELPAASPAAKVMQRVGLTDVTVEYSSPAVKGRKVFGQLVPYGQVWRAGANAATKVTFSRDVTFGDKAVPAGTYALVAIPAQKGAWTVALNKELGLFQGKTYDQAQDVVRVQASPARLAQPRERLTYLFSNATEDAATLDLEWERVRLPVALKTDTPAHAKANIQAALQGAPSDAATARKRVAAARYLSESLKEHDAALEHVNAGLAIESNWYAVWSKAEILARKGQYAEAHTLAQQAHELGEKSQNFFFKADVEKALKEWKRKG
jgi:hypothetical protein